MRSPEQISVDTARRIALAAQGFADPRPSGRIDVRHLRRVVDRVGVLQLDSVNVVCRSHYLPVFARLGAYPRETLDRMAWESRGRALFEFWGHSASLLPLSAFPLLRWRMQAATAFKWDTLSLARWRESWDPAIQAPWAVLSGMARLHRERPGLVDEVLALVAERGPVAARDANPDGVRHGNGQDIGTGQMWNWQDAKIALEWLFCMGRVTTAARKGFERLYDLTERVIPADVRSVPAPSAEDAQRELVRIAARACGVATEKQLRGYFGLNADHSKARIRELVDADELTPVRVAGVPQQMYLWPGSQEPGQVRARALLSPFDSLIWNRDRMLQLFGFHYRISIYTPEAQRHDGYYVMPFLLGDRLVARVDVKADRKDSVLRVPVANIEPDASEQEVVGELVAELRLMADWLELDRVATDGRGNLGRALSQALTSRRS